MSKAQLESLQREAEQAKAECRRQAEESRQALDGLRAEHGRLLQRCERLERELEEMKKAVGELLDTKMAFEARERQVRKLSKQLMT